MNITLYALSSDGVTRYAVEFTYFDNTLTARCGCMAGEFGKYCKHVALFLSGDPVLLCDRDQANELALVASWAESSEFKRRFAEVLQREAEIEKAKKALKRTKEEVWNDLYNGLTR